MQIVTWAILPARRSRAAQAWTFRVLGRAKLRTSSPEERMAPDRTGSASIHGRQTGGLAEAG
jgi:hypothetical protein